MGVLPIGFFAPLPLAIMIPFMAAQSFAMGHAFGTSFQYGKRKISSMTNEEFNVLNVTDLHNQLQADIRGMIPSMNESFHRMESFQIEIIQSMINTLSRGVDAFAQFLTQGNAPTGPPPASQALGGDLFEGEGAFAAADDSSFQPSGGGQQKFANDYEREAMRLGFKLLLSIVKTFGTRTDIPVEKRVGYLNAFKKLEQIEKDKIAARDTPAESIAKTTTAGSIVEQIATMYDALTQALLAALGYSKKTGFAAVTSKNKWLKVFLDRAKAYNRFVASNRKPQLQIDTAKSMAAFRPIAKT